MDFFTTPLAISLAVVLTVLVIVRSHGRAFGDDQKKKRYHPVATTVISSLINFSRLYDHMTEIAHKQKTARSLLLFRTDVYTSDPANVEYILKTNFSNYGREFAHHSLMSDVFGDGIFNVDGERWLHRRKVSSNELSTRVVRDISTAVFKTNAGKLARIIYSESATCHQAIDIQDLFMKASLDSILDILLGIDIDTLCGSNEEGIQFSHAFDQANEITMYRFLDVSWKIKRFLNIGSEAVLRNNIKVIDQFIYKLIKMKTDTIHNSEDELPALKRGDMVSRLLELRDAADPKYLRDLIFSLIIAGKDTTATSLSWFVYLLCRNPHIQETIVQEVRETTNLKDDFSIDELVDSLTEENLGKLQYLHAALSETLRLYPPVPLSAKSCLSDDTWPDGFSVKKGDMVGYAAYCMGRMKYLWGDDAEEFRPERWLNENGLFQPESPFKFVAFNAGPRICVGKDFAYRQMKMVSAVLLGSYLFKLKDEKRVANYSMKVTLHIKGGLYVQAYPRSGLARP